jgi:hypothetical protein
MVDMKKAKELFQETTSTALKTYLNSRKQGDELREKLKALEETEAEASQMLIDAMNKLEVKMLAYHQRYQHDFATIIRLENGKLTMEQTHLLETS